MSTHTPGPWTVTGREMNHVHDSDNHIVACAFHVRWPLSDRSVQEATANARLIAAAPDLLEALKEIAEWVDRYTTPGHPISTVARAAIAKATGGDA